MRSTSIPAYSWSRRFDTSPPEYAGISRFDLRTIYQTLPGIIRMVFDRRKEQRSGRLPVFNMYREAQIQPIMGVPLGGLGGGTITRGWRGDFVRWQLQPGIVRIAQVPADMFSLWTQRDGQPPAACVLFPGHPEEHALPAWSWSMPEAAGEYHALFPRAWTTYENPLPGIRLTCRQVSPVIPNNYQESSYPASVFVWEVENTGKEPVSAALMFTFQNGTGAENDLAGGHSNHLRRIEAEDRQVTAIELRHIHRQPRLKRMGKSQDLPPYKDALTFAIAAEASHGVEVSYRTRFITNSSGKDIWDDFSSDGRLDYMENEHPSPPGLSIGAGLAARVDIPAGETRMITFALAWDMPVARFGSGTGWYRRYTRFYGRDGSAAAQIAGDALQAYLGWEKQIDMWQQPVLSDPGLPDWYKSALFNETYFLVDGGTIWTDGQVQEGQDLGLEVQNREAGAGQHWLPEPEMGHFAYLESHEYLMYNTYDVHFSASFALAQLWPRLELSLQRDFLKALKWDQPEQRLYWFTGVRGPRKVRGIVPHDLGSPVEDPWRELNAYQTQDVGRWKDLNSKFVLQLYRDCLMCGEPAFIQEAYPAVREAIKALQAFDRDGDGLIENEGFPDQTYDTWTMRGVSAYCAGLWLAALQAAAAMAAALNREDEAREYRQIFEKGQQAYEEKLWNGEYYHFDTSRSKQHDSIMADMLAGHWFAQACGLPGVVKDERAKLALLKIYDFNVKKVHAGEFGAINGMRPSGQIDASCMQSAEMWIGTTYTFAAALLQEGMALQGFEAARGAYQAVYHDYGLWFQTPEAISARGANRAIGYMRPLAIWAIQWAWQRSKNSEQPQDIEPAKTDSR